MQIRLLPGFENFLMAPSFDMPSPPVSRRGEPAWEIARLFPTQGNWTEAEYLAFENAAHWYAVALRTMNFVASNTDETAKRFQLHVKRGRAFFAVGQWASARSAFEAAANLLDPAAQEKRAELLVHLAETAFWLMDVPAIRKFAGEAQVLAGRIGRDDLWADAQAWLASAMVSDGEVLAAIRFREQVREI